VENFCLRVDRALAKFNFGSGQVVSTERGLLLVSYAFQRGGEQWFVSVSSALGKNKSYVAVADGVTDIFYFKDLQEIIPWLEGIFNA
jgi:hypothetical protein